MICFKVIRADEFQTFQEVNVYIIYPSLVITFENVLKQPNKPDKVAYLINLDIFSAGGIIYHD